MARMLTRCDGCKVHIFADETTCPFCKRSRRIGAKKTFAVAAGAIAFMSGIGCAYGCPDGQCGDDFAPDLDATSDVTQRADVMIGDSTGGDVLDAGATDAIDEQTDAPSDADDASDTDDGG